MNSLSTGIFLLVILAIPVTTYARYDESDAKNDCKRAIKSDGRYSHFADVHIKDKGHYSYLVTGKVRSGRDDRKHSFDCQVRHREVTSWHIDPVKTISSHDGGSNTAAAVGAGLLSIAIIAAISSHDDDENHDGKRDSYNSGAGSSPFDDMHYLSKECKRELRSHLDHDHGKVRILQFTYVDWNGLMSIAPSGWLIRLVVLCCWFSGQVHLFIVSVYCRISRFSAESIVMIW